MSKTDKQKRRVYQGNMQLDVIKEGLPVSNGDSTYAVRLVSYVVKQQLLKWVERDRIHYELFAHIRRLILTLPNPSPGR